MTAAHNVCRTYDMKGPDIKDVTSLSDGYNTNTANRGKSIIERNPQLRVHDIFRYIYSWSV